MFPLTTLFDGQPTRRRLLRTCGVGLAGLTLPQFLGWRNTQAASKSVVAGFGKARACIILYCWGGTSQLDTWDPKPDAPKEVRGEFSPIATTVPGVRFSEHMPFLSRQMDRLSVVRSLHHRCTAHGKSMYWNLTGHAPPRPEAPTNESPSVNDWPSIGALVSHVRSTPLGVPGACQIPYPLVDNDTLQAGDGPGWLGGAHRPLLLRPTRGRPYGGVSRDLGAPVLEPARDVDTARLEGRTALREHLERLSTANVATGNYSRFQDMAHELLVNPKVRATLNLDREPLATRDRYGDHLGGQSILLSRRLVEAGVPLVTVICGAGDLNGGAGDHWDTHSDNFTRLKRDLLPPLDRASSALLDDLSARGMLDQTLVVWLTEFGRTPKMTGNGRNHYPNVYSIALAGGGVRGGQVYGSSDAIAAYPHDRPCGPEDVHATILHALGIPPATELRDAQGRPLTITEGTPLTVF
jgi:hypothetical protein